MVTGGCHGRGIHRRDERVHRRTGGAPGEHAVTVHAAHAGDHRAFHIKLVRRRTIGPVAEIEADPDAADVRGAAVVDFQRSTERSAGQHHALLDADADTGTDAAGTLRPQCCGQASELRCGGQPHRLRGRGRRGCCGLGSRGVGAIAVVDDVTRDRGKAAGEIPGGQACAGAHVCASRSAAACINAAQKYKKQFDLMNNNPSLYAEVSLYIGTVIKTYEELIAEAVVKREESKLNISEKKYLDAIKILKKEKNIFLLVYDEKDYKSMLREATAYLSDIYFDRFEFFLRKGTDFDQAKKNLDKIKNLFSLAHMTVLSNYIRMYCVFKMYDEAVQLINNTDNSKLICDKLNIESWLSINIGDIYAGKFAFLINNNSGEENELINCGNNALKYYLLAKDFINSNDFPTENRAVIENNIAVISSILNELNDSY